MADMLTAAQEETFLLAYRNTFNAEDHSGALKLVYADFSERFGVPAETLRALVRADLAANSRLYGKLRSALEPRKKKSANKGDGGASARAHPCRICGEVVAVNRKGAMRLHDAEGRSGRVACPGAGMTVAPNLRKRRGKRGIDPISTALPASRFSATTGRLNDSAKSSPKGVRKVIGGGLPGLGKNNK
jgi:hypothetical protein